MKLSIGMMVKNEEKYLDKCLNALVPLLENLESELIIVDTGSSDSTMKIAQKYTDKVYFHNWNNDFSEMRNVVLSYCTGQWVLSIDGDEIFEDCANIIEFFNSKEYEKYSCATINIKNITKKGFHLFSPPRLFKKDKDFKYNGIIHEQPIIREPVKYLNVYCNHYGYLFEDRNFFERKCERNITLLKNALSKDPNNVYYLYNLAISYGMHNEHNQAVEIIKRAYNLIKEQTNKDNHMNIYQILCAEHLNIQDYICLEKYAVEALKIQNDYIDSYYFLGIAQMKLEKNHEAISTFNTYLKLCDDFHKSENHVGLNYYSLGYINNVYGFLAEIYIENHEYLNAISTLLKIDENKYDYKELQEKLIEGIIESCNYELLLKYENDLSSRKKQLNDFWAVLENYKTSLDEKTSNLIEEIFSNGTTNYDILNKLRIELKKNNSVDLKKYNQFISDINLSGENYYYGDLIYCFLINKYDIAKLFSNCTFDTINKYFQYILEKYKDISEVIYDYIKNTEIKDRFIYIRLYKELCYYLIILNGLEKKKMEEIYDLYIIYGFKYMNSVYTDFVINMTCIKDVKNEEEAFLLLLNKAFRYKEKNIHLFIKTLKEALEILNPMRNLIGFLLNNDSEGSCEL